MPVNVGRGKQYRTVQERLEAAHGEKAQPVGINCIHTELRSMPGPSGPVVVITAAVTFEDGRVFTGISEAQFDATSGADKTNPIEVAETSAVGRALAFAGYYGSDDGIAGAEEVRRAQQRQAASVAEPKDPLFPLKAAYSDLCLLAAKAGVPYQPLPPQANEQTVRNMGAALKEAIQQARAK